MKQWRVATTDEIRSRVRRAVGEPTGRPPVLAVDGRSSSGKTTFAGHLARVWDGATVVHTDDIAWRQAVLDWTDLLVDGVLTPARAGLPVTYRPPKWTEADRPGSIEVPATCTLLIVEGVGSGRRDLTAHVDAVVWIESPPDDVEHRNATPAGADHDAWMAEEIPFVAAEQTWDRAAFLIAGWPAVPHDPATEFVICS